MEKKFLLLLLILFVTSVVNCQDDCPGEGAKKLTGSTYYWYWNEDLSNTQIYHSNGLYDLATARTLVANYIQSALDKWCSAAGGVLSFSRAESTGPNTLEFCFVYYGDPLHYGHYLGDVPFAIEIAKRA